MNIAVTTDSCHSLGTRLERQHSLKRETSHFTHSALSIKAYIGSAGTSSGPVDFPLRSFFTIARTSSSEMSSSLIGSSCPRVAPSITPHGRVHYCMSSKCCAIASAYCMLSTSSPDGSHSFARLGVSSCVQLVPAAVGKHLVHPGGPISFCPKPNLFAETTFFVRVAASTGIRSFVNQCHCYRTDPLPLRRAFLLW